MPDFCEARRSLPTKADFARLIPKGPKPPLFHFGNRREQGAGLRDDAVPELRVTHLRRPKHRLAFLVVVDPSLARFIELALIGAASFGVLQYLM